MRTAGHDRRTRASSVADFSSSFSSFSRFRTLLPLSCGVPLSPSPSSSFSLASSRHSLSSLRRFLVSLLHHRFRGTSDPINPLFRSPPTTYEALSLSLSLAFLLSLLPLLPLRRALRRPAPSNGQFSSFLLSFPSPFRYRRFELTSFVLTALGSSTSHRPIWLTRSLDSSCVPSLPLRLLFLLTFLPKSLPGRYPRAPARWREPLDSASCGVEDPGVLARLVTITLDPTSFSSRRFDQLSGRRSSANCTRTMRFSRCESSQLLPPKRSSTDL